MVCGFFQRHRRVHWVVNPKNGNTNYPAKEKEMAKRKMPEYMYGKWSDRSGEWWFVTDQEIRGIVDAEKNEELIAVYKLSHTVKARTRVEIETQGTTKR